MASAVSRDLSVDGNGDLQVVGGDLVLTVDIDAIAQDIKATLLLFQGEWFLAPDQGVPYYGTVLVKNPNLAVIRGVFRRAIQGVLGVVQVLSIQLAYVGSSRQLQVTHSTQTNAGIIDQTILLPGS